MNFFTSSSEGRGPVALLAATFAGVALLLFSASEALVRTSVLHQDEFIAHAHLFMAARDTDAAFGDSHVARGFYPPKGMVNLAYPSEGIEHMDWKVRSYFADKDPGRVIVQADPHLLAPYRPDCGKFQCNNHEPCYRQL